MKTTDFSTNPTAAQLNESMFKQFGNRVDFDKYTREDLENYRNLLRTKVNQTESAAGFNDLLANEDYQKDKFMMDLLNTRIKEMLGESKQTISEKAVSKSQQQAAGIALAAKKAGKKPAGKGAAAEMSKMSTKELEKFAGTKHKGLPKKVKEDAKPDFLDLDKDGDKKEPMKKAAKEDKCCCEAKGKANCPVHGKMSEAKNAKPDFLDMDKDGNKKETMKKAVADKKKKAVKESIKRAHYTIIIEGLNRFLAEDEEGKAKDITAGTDMVNDFTSWMQRVGQYQTKSMIELADSIRANFGQAEADTFKAAIQPALQEALTALTQSRETITRAVAVLAGEEASQTPMGADTPDLAGGAEDEFAPADMDTMNPGDEFGASDAAAGGAETSGREMRESRAYARAKKLAESHSIMSKLAR